MLKSNIDFLNNYFNKKAKLKTLESEKGIYLQSKRVSMQSKFKPKFKGN